MSDIINNLIRSLMCLPGVGPRSAERMAYHLLLNAREKGQKLAHVLEQAMSTVTHCNQCNDFSEVKICRRCQSGKRNQTQLCIVEMPLDLRALEQSGVYQGQYFVLLGCLSPIDGIGPEQLHIERLLDRVNQLPLEEVIFAINPSVEGEATVQFIQDKLAHWSLKFSQLARGIPMGGELSFLDASTIVNALDQRSSLKEDTVV